MGKHIIGESWGEYLTLFGSVVMANYGKSFSFHPIRFIYIGESWGECLTLFGIVVIANYGKSFSFHPIRFI
jgi:hypothetical protein